MLRAERVVVDVVLDTNVVLDWLVFEDLRTRALAAAIAEGRWRWIGTHAMLEELAVVLSRPALARWSARLQPALATAARCCSIAAPARAAPALGLRCADPDDQMFIDLAIEHRAKYLFSRDKALLRLALAASLYGVAVRHPAESDTGQDQRKRATEVAR